MVRHFERITESILLPPWLKHEHEGRYSFCRSFVRDRFVLDCGSGEGKGSNSIVKGRPRRMLALDRSLESVSRAQTDEISAVAGSAERLPLRPQSLEIIVALEVIEHFDDPEAFLRDVRSSLKAEGLLICSTPNRRVRNPRLPLDGKPLNPWHLREWTPEEFSAMLARHFGNVEMYAHVPQYRRTSAFFNAVGRVWPRGAAILRQLLKFRTIVWARKELYVVQPFRYDVDFEFIVCVCSQPR